MRLFVCGLLAQGVASAAPPPPVQVVACGQTVPVAATGVLTTDLDCTGADGIKLAARAKLDLAGHTLSGDAFAGVECAGICTVTGPGAIQGFKRGIGADRGSVKVEGVDFANQISGIVGRRAVQVKGATFTGHDHDAITGVKAVKIENSSFVDNELAVGSSSTVKLVSTCAGTSSKTFGGTWGVCALD